MNNTSSFSSMQEVINIQNNVLKTISGQIHTKGIDLTKFIKEREISELENLKIVDTIPIERQRWKFFF